jgi:hypothetical protein
MGQRWALPGLVLALTLAVAAPIAAQTPSPTPGDDLSLAPSTAPSSLPAATASPVPGAAATCEYFGIEVDRCYAGGSARIAVRGAARRAVTVPLRIGERGVVDLAPEISLTYWDPNGHANVIVILPPAPGEADTPVDGNEPGPAEARLSWTIAGLDVPDDSGLGCTIRYEAGAAGTLTGTASCPHERSRSGKRYRVTVTFEALPAVPGPLPTFAPSVPPATLAPAEPACGLLDGATIERVLGLPEASVLLHAAGPGQCFGIADDREVAFGGLSAGGSSLALVPGAAFRGAECTPLVSPGIGDGSVAASCVWPDGRHFVVGDALTGTSHVLISLVSGERTVDELLAGVATLLEAGVATLP